MTHNKIANRSLSKKEQEKYDNLCESKGKEAANNWLRNYLEGMSKQDDIFFLQGSSFESERNPMHYYYGSSNVFRESMKSRR